MILYVLRPVKLEDLNQLKVLIEGMSSPIASLPNDKLLLKKRIRLSERSFKKTVLHPNGEYYLFILEDLETGEIVGTSAIYGMVGGRSFFFAYQIHKEVFSYSPLGICKTVDVLHFHKIRKGPSELCSLYLSPRVRKHGLGVLLSFGRYLFINAFRLRFAEELVANLKGARDAQGDSPFWKAIGEVFFGGKLSTVDTMKSLGHKTFIRALMPKHPIYIPLLSKEVQATIGGVSIDTKPAFHLLEKEGFSTSEWLDIFDAGPYLAVKTEKVQTIQNIRVGEISKIIETTMLGQSKYLIGNNVLDFRVCMGDVILCDDGSIHIHSNVAQALKVQIGNTVSFAKY